MLQFCYEVQTSTGFVVRICICLISICGKKIVLSVTLCGFRFVIHICKYWPNWPSPKSPKSKTKDPQRINANIIWEIFEKYHDCKCHFDDIDHCLSPVTCDISMQLTEFLFKFSCFVFPLLTKTSKISKFLFPLNILNIYYFPKVYE